VAWAFLMLCAGNMLPQGQTTGRLVGTVSDQNGAVIVGAEVTVSNNATGQERKVITDDGGNFSVPLLAPGSYRVRVAASGFKSALFDQVQVVITETAKLNAQLIVTGIIVDPVTVRIAPLIQQGGPQLGRVVDSRAVSELPLATRNFIQILALSPGTAVALPDNAALGRNSQNVAVNGARVTQNNFQLNGVDANQIHANNSTAVAVPAPETIEEFKVQTSLYDASFGRGGGGNIQAVTKGGSNHFHGAGYEYFRNTALNANNPFLKAVGVKRPTLQRNVFGGLLGGPVRINRSFFFISYQGTRERNGASDNSLSSNILVSPPGLTDDRSPQTLLATFRPRLPNGLPATSVNPVALNLLNVKLPDGQFVIPTPQPNGHYSGSAVSSYREDQFNTNIDYQINQRNSLTVKFFFSNAPQFVALPSGGANVPGFGADRQQNNHVISLQDIHILGPKIVNEARAGYSFTRQDAFGRDPVKDSDVGIKRANADVYPGLGLIRLGAGGMTIGNAGTNVDIQAQDSTTTFIDILSITRGQHNIRTGGEILNYRVNVTTNNNRRGQIVFQNSDLNSAFSNFLLGSAANSVFGDGINTRILRATDYSLFLQDDWKVSRKLTLNLGLRYELDLPPYETRGALATFDPALYEPRMEVDSRGNPVGPPIGGFVQAGNVIPQFDLADVPNVGKRMFRSIDPNNLVPRVGFGYSPLNSGRLIVRGGYGIFYSRPSLLYISLTINSPPTYAIRRSPPGAAVPLSDPFVPLPPQNQFPTFVKGVALGSNIFDRGMRTPYFNQYNVSLQYALGKNMLVEAAYVGTHGVNLLRNVAINQAQLASAQHPIINDVTGQLITTNTPANALLRTPYQGVEVPGFFQIQATAQSTYNSLQMSLSKRFSKGLQFLVAYTYAKSLDNASAGTAVGELLDTANIQGNQFDNRANRGLSDFDRKHRLVMSFLWDLPRPAFAESRVSRLLFSNWQVAGIITAMSGAPLDIMDGGAGSLYGFGSNNILARPSWAPGATRTTATNNVPAGYFFNPFAFVRPVVQAGQPIPSSNGTARADALGIDIGNVGRNVLRGPRQTNVDFSIIKRFPFSESKNIEFRAEFFNLLNHVNFANPISNFNAVPSTSLNPNSGQIIGDPGDFGRILATSNNPRLIQLALKINF
jgi:hypothetical protein